MLISTQVVGTESGSLNTTPRGASFRLPINEIDFPPIAHPIIVVQKNDDRVASHTQRVLVDYTS